MSAAKKALRLVGSALSIACLAWIGWNFYSTGLLQQLSADGLAKGLYVRVASAAVIYAFAVALLGGAWAILQRVFVVHPAYAGSVSTYLITQVYKYLPGGVLQYVGRHAALRKLGIAHSSLALCALAEAACLVAVASVTSASAIARLGYGPEPVITRTAVITLIFVAMMLFSCLRSRVRWIIKHVPTFHPWWAVGSLGLYGTFFLLMSFTLTNVAPAQLASHLSLATWAGVAALSWIAGFLVVGAPAGLGVREAVFVALLTGLAAKPDILLMAACFRVATFAGDILAYLVGVALHEFLKRRPAGLRPTTKSRPLKAPDN